MCNGANTWRRGSHICKHSGHTRLQKHNSFIEDLKLKLGLDEEYDILCGYEAGCLGYSLYNQLTGAGIKCEILAPTTMLTLQGVRIKTDARDALMIAQCLAYGGYHAVYVPTEEDDLHVHDFIIEVIAP